MEKNNKLYINVKESERIGNNRKKTIKYLAYSVLLVLFFVRCIDKNSASEEGIEQETAPLTEEKCINFAEQLHYSLVDSNANYINSYLDWKSIEESVTGGDPLKKAIYDTLLSNYDLATDFINIAYSDADVRFITYYQEEESHYLIFRIYEQPQILDVYEFELNGNSKELFISDIYDFSSASSVSESLREEVDFWSSWGKEWVNYFELFKENQRSFNEAMLNADLKKAFLVTKQLPEEFHDLRRFRQMYGLICEYSGNAELLIGYLHEELERIPLTEKGRWLPLFYLRSIEGNYGESLIALSNLEKEIGKDVYIDFLKGNIYFEMNDYESAITYFNRSLSEDSEVMIFHLGKIHSYINLGMYVEAVESLLVMDDFFEIDSLDWNQEFSSYPDFVSSSEFEEFLSRLN